MANLIKETLINEEELFCDADEELANLKISEDEDFNDSEEYDYDYYDEDDRSYYKAAAGQHNNPQAASNKVANYQPHENLIRKFTNKINVEKYEGPVLLTNFATNRLIEKQRQNENDRIRVKDKHDRATAEQVMDPRTRMILFKLLNRNVITEINGCISTGKEANVYHATLKNGSDCAIKIYKTSILVFKDRDKYVSGEFRFRNGYCRHNPRKMVRTWAEKELRNLSRMYNNQLQVPEPILLRSHVLLMGFIGEDGWPAPKLKDVELSPSKAREIYRDVVVLMWKMYNKCKLVHADLSEFNMLYQNGEIYIIDVSQSVEHDHPRALNFLRKDCTNITDYFRKKNVATMSIKELFDFITDPTITEENIDECLDKLSENAALRDINVSSQDKVDEEVFKNAYIPKRLTEVIDFERDIIQAKSGAAEELVYKTLVGLKSDLSGTIQNPEILHVNEENSIEEDNGSEDDLSGSPEESSEEESNFVNSSRPKHETSEEKKARKKAVKEEKSEKRKQKVKNFFTFVIVSSNYMDATMGRSIFTDLIQKHPQFEKPFKSTSLRNWEVPHWYPKHPCTNHGRTTVIANNKGNLLPGIPRQRGNLWSNFIGTWHYPKKIDRETANKLSAPPEDKVLAWKRHCERSKEKTKKEELFTEEEQKAPPKDSNKNALVPYVPGDFTEEKYRAEGYEDLVKYRYNPTHIRDDAAALKGYPRTREDFLRQPPKEKDLKQTAENFYRKHRDMLTEKYESNECYSCRKDKRWNSSILAAIKNFNLAKKLHKENLEHQPLPDALADSMYRKLQMQRHREPGLALKNGNYASGVAWKAYAGYGPTRCTKLKVFRPKTSICNKIKDSADDRPSSVSSFDKKWRFIRQSKVTPIQLAVSWDLTPINPHDEPKRTVHIDGSNGSQAPAVFSLVHTPNGHNEEQKCDGLHSYSNNIPYVCDQEVQRPKTASNGSGSISEKSMQMKRVQSAVTHVSHTPNPIFSHLPPNSPEHRYSNSDCLKKNQNVKEKHLCVACELKNINLKDTKPKSEFKMAFKAGIPQKVSTNYLNLCNIIRIPKMKDPYKKRNYTINSLAPPFSFQNCKRHEYPEHWRLATIYQHSYKPIQARKRPLLATVFK
ncbi:hypothetical protein FQA39_LY00512 [Lamprigera yunnana]|nr:hypothetical protein FQA39_LY00512 [Lamprigera yunnana]